MTPRSRRAPAKNSAKTTAKTTPRPLTGFRLAEALIAGWRPLQRLDVDGFALLRSRGVTRRANSALALEAPTADDALNGAIERVEALYAMAGEPSTFRVLDMHGPAQLDTVLAERGYESTGHSALLATTLRGARLPDPHPSAEIRTGALDEDWFEAAWLLAPRDGDQARETMHDILAGTPAVQVLLRAEGDLEGGTGAEPVAVGRAALVEAGRETVAVLNMIAVDPAHRRRGLGRALSQTLLAIAAVQGADRVLLEVEQDNAPALALYRGLGFEHLGEYHYRVRTAPSDPT
ncbi:N-acetyltransferase [Brachybacterium sp. FME24]|uniref:GNAT family N-acetyltransferase n=1 Tax=Brachybacterium sp. FME24 TaxID=2742605 RepID=UPI001867043D|nr:N-acetyltransferase [Brachybacterium sp. FME24]